MSTVTELEDCIAVFVEILCNIIVGQPSANLFVKFPTRLSFCCSGFLINRDSNICSHLLANSIECLQRRNKKATCSLTNTSSDQLLGSLGNLVISSRFGSILLVLGNLFLKLHVTFNGIIFMPTTLPTICA